LLVLAWGNWYVRMARPATSWSDVARALLVAFLPLVGFVLARDNGAYVYFMALAVVLLPLAWPWLATQWLAAMLVGVLATAVLLAGFAALDSSFATLFTVALVMAVAGAAGLYLLRRSGRLQLQPHAAWALPAGLAAAGVAALHLGSAVVNAGSTVSASQPVQIADLERIVAIDGNSIRLLDLIAPRTVEGLGLRQGYEQRAAMSEMFAYAATLTGRGWPGTAMPRELRVTHVDDAVTAVHLVAPFGRIAALGLAGLLGAFALGSAVLLRAREDVSAQQARLAVATLLSVSLYMLFANIGVVPFTGRNFYFLSVASNSDLLEGGLLLAIVAWALTSAPVETPSIEARLPAEVES
jgi:cell division protein FtsW (lipid II flippase)